MNLRVASAWPEALNAQTGKALLPARLLPVAVLAHSGAGAVTTYLHRVTTGHEPGLMAPVGQPMLVDSPLAKTHRSSAPYAVTDVSRGPIRTPRFVG